MQVTKGTWRMRKQCVPGSFSSSPTQEPGNEATSIRPSSKSQRLPPYLVALKVLAVE